MDWRRHPQQAACGERGTGHPRGAGIERDGFAHASDDMSFEMSERAHECGVALTAATAQCRSTETATATAQLVDERHHDAGTRHTDRVTERDRTAVHVDDVVVDAEIGHRRETNSCERLVELEQVD